MKFSLCRAGRVASLATAALLAFGFGSPAFADSTDPLFPTTSANDPCTSISALVARPTVTNGVCTVAPDHQLLEAGFGTYKSSGQTGTVYPEAELRIGTDVKHLELQVTAPSYTHVVPANSASNLGDAAIGARYFLGNTKRYAHALQVTLGLPIGDSSVGYNSSYSYNGSYQLNSMFTLSGTLALMSNVSSANTGTVRYGSFVPSLELSAAFPQQFTGFVEGASYSHQYGQGTSAMQYMVGATKALGKRAQVDAEYTIRNDKVSGSPNFTTHGFGAGLALYH